MINSPRLDTISSSVLLENIKIFHDKDNKDDFGRLLLHRSCMATNVNIDEIKHLLNTHPEDLKVKDRDGRLPLHLALLSTLALQNFSVLALEKCAIGMIFDMIFSSN